MASYSVCFPVCKPDVERAIAGFDKLLMDNGEQEQGNMRISNRCFSKRMLLLSVLGPAPFLISSSPAIAERPQFSELEGSGGLKALDIREGSGRVPQPGDKVAIHYYARLAAKQGWRYDSTYDHKDSTGAPEPFLFVIKSGTVRLVADSVWAEKVHKRILVIEGLDKAVQSMKEGGVRRVIIPPSQGYQNTMQEPIPPNVFDRQRLYTTIFNPTRLANGEGSTLGTLIFDIELLRIRPN